MTADMHPEALHDTNRYFRALFDAGRHGDAREESFYGPLAALVENKYGDGSKAEFVRDHILANFYAFELMMSRKMTSWVSSK